MWSVVFTQLFSQALALTAMVIAEWGRCRNVPDGGNVEERVLESEELVFAGGRHDCLIARIMD